MGQNRVAVLVNGSVLTSGVLSLLSELPTLKVVPVLVDAGVCQHLRTIAPDVIIVDADGAEHSQVAIERLFQACPRARVITVGVDRSDLDVYDSRRVSCTSVVDLLGLIVDRRGPNAEPDGSLMSRPS